jgi:hypothetical protein
MPHSVSHMFGGWLLRYDRSLRSRVLVVVAAMRWAIWLSRNDIVFGNCPTISYLQVLLRGNLLVQTLDIAAEA